MKQDVQHKMRKIAEEKSMRGGSRDRRANWNLIQTIFLIKIVLISFPSSFSMLWFDCPASSTRSSSSRFSQLIHNITSPYTRIEEINQQRQQQRIEKFLLALIKIPHQFAIKQNETRTRTELDSELETQHPSQVKWAVIYHSHPVSLGLFFTNLFICLLGLQP